MKYDLTKAVSKFQGAGTIPPRDIVFETLGVTTKAMNFLGEKERLSKSLLKNLNFVSSPVKRSVNPGILATAIGAGAIGGVMGDGDWGSVAMSSGVGLLGGGAISRVGSRVGARYAGNHIKNFSAGAIRNQGRGIASMLNNPNSRRSLFAAGALLSGGAFSSMYGGNGSTYKNGFNANRGNSIVR